MKTMKLLGKRNHNNNNNNNNRSKSRGTEEGETTLSKLGTTSGSADMDQEDVSVDSIYEFYTQELFPAILASLPILWNRLSTDVYGWLLVSSRQFLEFLSPAIWSSSLERNNNNDDNDDTWSAAVPENLRHLWEQAVEKSSQPQAAVADFMLRQFDTNGDGHISSAELLNISDLVSTLQQQLHQSHHYYDQHQQQFRGPQTFWAWFSREWPLMDWKLGVFVWKSFGGFLIVLAILSFVPGRLHRTTGKILRWPILGLTYFLILVELTVYSVIRCAIIVAEFLVARPKHRNLRRKMKAAKNYRQWYEYASELDKSQKRDQWQRTVNDNTSYRYNWAFIRQLMGDLRTARAKNDSLLALAVLQQCTRKNVGGIMSEDLFSYTNTGDPKHIVTEFVQEVTQTLQWITDEALKIPEVTTGEDEVEAKLSYEQRLERQVRKEKEKLWKSLISWATLNFTGGATATAPPPTSTLPKRTASIQNQLQELAATKQQRIEYDPQSIESIPTPEIADSASLAGLSHSSGDTIPRVLPGFHKKQLIGFLKRARAAYGRTALCLSGGAMMGLYHFGHIIGLLETGCLPHIISGTSAGSVVGAVLCTRTDEELNRDLTPEVLGDKLLCFSRPWLDRIKSVWNNGHLFDFNEWMDMIQWFTCGDMTFEEAYEKTGRIFCITLSSTTKKAPPILLNYISAPNVTIASAVIASAAVPGFIPPVVLQYKDSDGKIRPKGGSKDETYFDGSIQQDIPANGLAEMLNCQFFVACQCNPHVVPFFFNGKGGVGRPSRWSSGEQEDSWRGGFLLAALEMYLKNDMKAKFHFLNDVEAAVGFTSTMMTQQFEGSTTIVPQVRISDYFKLFSNPDAKELHRYFQGGAVAAYQHAAMIRLHYRIADALDECLQKLEHGTVQFKPSRSSVVQSGKKVLLDGMDYFMPSVITAALNETVDNDHDRSSDSTSMSEESN